MPMGKHAMPSKEPVSNEKRGGTTHERYGTLGTVVGLLAVAALFGAFLVPLPGRPAPGYERDLMFQVQNWSRVVLFYGSGILLIVAILLWRLGREPR